MHSLRFSRSGSSIIGNGWICSNSRCVSMNARRSAALVVEPRGFGAPGVAASSRCALDPSHVAYASACGRSTSMSIACWYPATRRTASSSVSERQKSQWSAVTIGSRHGVLVSTRIASGPTRCCAARYGCPTK